MASIRKYIVNKGWTASVDPGRSKYMTVVVGFKNGEIEDETSFDIESYNICELEELFSVFCKENKITDNATYINIVAASNSLEGLEALELVN